MSREITLSSTYVPRNEDYAFPRYSQDRSPFETEKDPILYRILAFFLTPLVRLFD